MSVIMTEWEAHKVAAIANRMGLHGRSDWYVSNDKDGDPIIVDCEANRLTREDLRLLADYFPG